MCYRSCFKEKPVRISLGYVLNKANIASCKPQWQKGLVDFGI